MKIKVGNFEYDSGSIEVKNIIDPLIKLGSLFVLPIFAALLFLSYNLKTDIYAIIGIIFAALYFFLPGTMYIYFAIKDPNKLQSEKYLLEYKKLELNRNQKNEKDITNKSKLNTSDDSLTSIIINYDELKDSGDKE